MGVFKLENDGTDNSQYVVKEFDKAILLCFEYSDEKMFSILTAVSKMENSLV
jgi:hypothetical protein|tara:strand:+ start:1626 stop:1781 length:156 start_codon:yes stop_codon:yes gene_type:complete